MSYQVTVRRADASEPALGWTTRWDSATALGDWAVAGAADAANPGGLAADRQIASAVILSLFTDRRAPAGWRPEIADRRGWWGDDVSPEPYGSWLWLLKNEVVSPANVAAAKAYAEEALGWMLRDRVASRLVVTSGTIEDPQRGIWLDIQIFGRAGEIVFDQKFARLWREV